MKKELIDACAPPAPGFLAAAPPFIPQEEKGRGRQVAFLNVHFFFACGCTVEGGQERQNDRRMAQVSLKGLFILTALVWTALVGSLLFLTPALVLLLVPLDVARLRYRQWSGLVAKMWFSFATFLIEHVGGVQVVLSGDNLPFGEPAMIICNHRTRIDWMFLWCLCLRLGILDSVPRVKSYPGACVCRARLPSADPLTIMYDHR